MYVSLIKAKFFTVYSFSKKLFESLHKTFFISRTLFVSILVPLISVSKKYTVPIHGRTEPWEQEYIMKSSLFLLELAPFSAPYYS